MYLRVCFARHRNTFLPFSHSICTCAKPFPGSANIKTPPQSTNSKRRTNITPIQHLQPETFDKSADPGVYRGFCCIYAPSYAQGYSTTMPRESKNLYQSMKRVLSPRLTSFTDSFSTRKSHSFKKPSANAEPTSSAEPPFTYHTTPEPLATPRQSCLR